MLSNFGWLSIFQEMGNMIDKGHALGSHGYTPVSLAVKSRPRPRGNLEEQLNYILFDSCFLFPVKIRTPQKLIDVPDNLPTGDLSISVYADIARKPLFEDLIDSLNYLTGHLVPIEF